MGLRKEIVTHNAEDLPEAFNNIDRDIVELEKQHLRKALHDKYGNDVAKQITSLTVLAEKAKNGGPGVQMSIEDRVALFEVLADLKEK